MRKMLNLLILIILLLHFVCISCLYSAEYYVDKNHPQANDSNSGTEISPWLTIQRAANTMVVGDTVFVKSGTYNERVTPSNSGSAAGGKITYARWQDNSVVVRGFILSNRSHIRVIGFEITHNHGSYNYDALLLNNANHVEIIDNYIHHTDGVAINCTGGCSYITTRGNTIQYIGCPQNAPGQCLGTNVINFQTSNYILIEYNDISRVADFLNPGGSYYIYRNNLFGPNAVTDYPDYGTVGHHIDVFQPNNTTTYAFIERNYHHDSVVSNSHFFLDEVAAGHHYTLRENVSLRNGSQFLQWRNASNHYAYNNTIVDMWYTFYKQQHVFHIWDSNNNWSYNNIFYNASNNVGTPYAIDGGTIIYDYDLLYNSGNPNEAHDVFANPAFVSYSSDDLHLSAASPAIDAGTALTTVTSATGSGTSLTLAQAGFFTSGWGIVTGDSIRIGSRSPVTITDINYSTNTITVGSSTSWTNGDRVYLAHHGTTPDIGAFQYSASGYSYNVSITSPQSGNVVSGQVTIQTNLTNPVNVRMVIFYVDGVPKSTVYSSPYTYTWDTTGLRPKTYNIEARAYSLFADSTLTRSSRINLIVSSDAAPLPPQNLQIIQ